MNTRTLLYRLLYRALLDMRRSAREAGYRDLFKVTDLLHQLPLQLEQVARGQGSYAEVLAHLRQRSQDAGLLPWLEHSLEAAGSSQDEAVREDNARARLLLHRLLYHFFIDARYAAHEADNQEHFQLADLCHNIPLRLAREPDGPRDYDEILAWMQRRSQQNKSAEWLERVVGEEQKTAGPVRG